MILIASFYRRRRHQLASPLSSHFLLEKPTRLRDNPASHVALNFKQCILEKGVVMAGQFACDGCGKTYSWKAELAGRRVKCKCTQVLIVPGTDPAEVEALPEGFEDLYALAEGMPVETAPITPPAFSRGTPCPSCGASVESGAVLCVGCGHNLKTGKKVKTQTKAAGSGGAGGGRGGAPVLAGAVAGTGGGSPMLGYAAMARRRNPEAEARGGDLFFHPVKDLYIPAALILLGFVLSCIVMVSYYNVHNPGLVLLAVAIQSVLSIVLSIPGILLAIKLFDLGIGPLGPGILKLAACAIAPGALGDIVGKVMLGGMSGYGGYLGWIVTYASTVAIFMSLLEMDYFEVVVCSAIIFVFRWIGLILMLILLSHLGVQGLPASGFSSGGGRIMLSGDVDEDLDESLDGPLARQSDAAMSNLLLQGGIEAKIWMEKSPQGILAGKNHDQSVQILQNLYGAGTLEIRVYPYTSLQGIDAVNRLIVVPPRPDAPGAKEIRARVMKQMKSLAQNLGRTTPRDRGEKYWPVKMMTPEQEEKEFSVSPHHGNAPETDPDEEN
jgi:hypothetical protein